jgi:RNA polymerase-binding transcription factor DksA
MVMNPIAAEAQQHLRERRAALLLLGHDVAEIESALSRIDEGVYGQCERCGGAIGRQRLRAIPEARLCIACTPL